MYVRLSKVAAIAGYHLVLTYLSVQAGVTKSCTVRLNNEIYCIRDGGKWTTCPSGPSVNDLVIAVEKLHRSSSS